MVELDKVLIVGGGIGGMCCAIRLHEQGHDVELVDNDPNWRVYGAGITITAPTLRAFKRIGILEEMRAQGYLSAGLRLFTAAGDPIGEIATPALEPDVPSNGGIMRPVLHSILSSRVRALGVTVRLGVTVDRLDDGADGARVTFTDGSAGTYGLVIGADGIYSRMRSLIFPEAPKPRFTGQGCWRIVAPRPPQVDRSEIYMGKGIKAGVNPVSPTHLYLFALSPAPANEFVPPSEQPERLRALLAPFGGSIAQARETIGPDSSIVYRPLEAVLQPAPWWRGRVLLVGDAAHATTPHLASGAGIAAEDAVVLAELLAAETSLPVALDAFMRRRYERCRLVVENSVRLGEIELSGGTEAENQALMASSTAALAAPI